MFLFLTLVQKCSYQLSNYQSHVKKCGRNVVVYDIIDIPCFFKIYYIGVVLLFTVMPVKKAMFVFG